MACSFQVNLYVLILIIISSSSSIFFTRAASFNESCRAEDPPCQALIAYRIGPSPSSIANISKLFSVSPQAILSANGFPPGADVEGKLANETLRIMLPCPCQLSNRQRAGGITYTVVAGDWLSLIAEVKFAGLVTYEEIAKVSQVVNPDQISIGQNLTIPYPCSCRNDMFPSRNVIFMSYVVQPGESAGVFAREYGVSVSQVRALNPGLNFEPTNVIRLPVARCEAKFNKDAADGNLTLASGSYLTTANGCVQCSCSVTERTGNNGSGLYCSRAPRAPATCSLGCPNSKLEIGQETTELFESGCKVESCLYDGYSSSIKEIFTRINNFTTKASCDGAEAPTGFAYAPEEQGVPEAVGGPATPSPQSNTSPNTPSAVATSPPPESASTQQSPSIFLLVLLMMLVAN